MDGKPLIIGLVALILITVLGTTYTGFVVKSESCCTGLTCPEEQKCIGIEEGGINPDLEIPGTAKKLIMPEAFAAILVTLMVIGIGIIFSKLKY